VNIQGMGILNPRGGVNFLRLYNFRKNYFRRGRKKKALDAAGGGETSKRKKKKVARVYAQKSLLTTGIFRQGEKNNKGRGGGLQSLLPTASAGLEGDKSSGRRREDLRKDPGAEIS